MLCAPHAQTAVVARQNDLITYCCATQAQQNGTGLHNVRIKSMQHSIGVVTFGRAASIRQDTSRETCRFGDEEKTWFLHDLPNKSEILPLRVTRYSLD